jgi:hypothetical protein
VAPHLDSSNTEAVMKLFSLLTSEPCFNVGDRGRHRVISR